MKRRHHVAARVTQTAPSPAPTGRPGVGRLVTLALAVVVVAAGVAWLAWVAVVLPARAARLPDLPDLAGRPQALVEHIRTADRAARRRPTSAETVGELCVAYHADGFLDQAAQCYAIAEELAPRGWRWPYYQMLLQQDRGRLDGAVETLRRVVNLNQNYAPAWFRLGEEEFKHARYAEAKAAYAQARAVAGRPTAEAPLPHQRRVLIPTEAYAALGIARVMQRQGDLEGARAMLEKLAVEAPDFSSARRLLAEIYARLGRVDDAERERSAASELRPYTPPVDPLADALVAGSRNSSVLIKAGSIAKRSGDNEWLEFLMTRALEIGLEDPEVVYQMALTLRDLGRPAEALQYFEQHHRMVPSDVGALNELGLLLIELGRAEEAEVLFREALATRDDGTVRYNLAVALQNRGRFDEALPHYLAAIEKSPNDAAPHINLGIGLAEQGKTSLAVQHFRRAINIQPDNVETHDNLGVLLVELGRLEEAQSHFEEALALAPFHANARNRLGETLAMQGRVGEAIAELERAVAVNPQHADALNNLGILLGGQGRLDEARRRFEAALAADPNNPYVHYNMGLTLLRLQRADEAILHVERAVALDPGHAEAQELLASLRRRPDR